MTTAFLLDVCALCAVAVTLAVRPVPPALDDRRRSWAGEPGLWLLVVVAAIVVNQVLFTVYVLRVYHGDASFLARYLPTGWFVLADDGPMRALAAVTPHPGLLAPTALRTQSFLELPFGLLATWTAVRWLDDGVYRALLRPWALWATSIGYDVAFMLIEAHFATPYRRDDLIIRAVSGLITPLVAGWWAARYAGRRDWRVSGPAGLAAFAVSALALGGFVLVRAERATGLTPRQRWAVVAVAGVAAAVGAVVIRTLPLRYTEANVLAGAAVALAVVLLGLMLLDRRAREPAAIPSVP